MNIIQEYFIDPIIYKTGYNPVNTIVYASIALIAIYLIYKKWEPLDDYFSKTVFAFTIFGSLKRVVTDAVDAGIITHPLLQELYKYSFWNVTPGIYVFVSFLLFFSLYLEKVLSKKFALKLGVALSLLHALILLPYLKHFHILAFVLFGEFLLYPLVKVYVRDELARLSIIGQALDGLSSSFAVGVLGYGEQHVLTSFIMNINPFLFPILKVLVTFLLVKILEKERDERARIVITLAVVVAGFAPGVRNTVRVMVGA